MRSKLESNIIVNLEWIGAPLEFEFKVFCARSSTLTKLECNHSYMLQEIEPPGDRNKFRPKSLPRNCKSCQKRWLECVAPYILVVFFPTGAAYFKIFLLLLILCFYSAPKFSTILIEILVFDRFDPKNKIFAHHNW